LRETSGNDELLARLLLVRVLQDGIGRFRLRRVDKRTRVDDDGIGLGGFGNEFPTGLAELRDHHLGIDEILRTSKRDESDTVL